MKCRNISMLCQDHPHLQPLPATWASWGKLLGKCYLAIMVNIESLRRAFEVWLANVLSTEALLCFQEKHLCIFCDGNTFYISDMPPPPTDHAEFARCPQPLPMGSPSLPVSSCELNKNTRRCHQQPLATHLSCRLYQTCDHAVLISGRTVYMFVFT